MPLSMEHESTPNLNVAIFWNEEFVNSNDADGKRTTETRIASPGVMPPSMNEYEAFKQLAPFLRMQTPFAETKEMK